MDADNHGAFKRLIIAENDFDMYGRLHVDIFFQDRLLINNMNVRRRLTRSKDAFCLMSDRDTSK